MPSQLRRNRPSHSTIVAYLALFAALGGTAFALSKNSVGSRQIKPGGVKEMDLAISFSIIVP